MVIVHKWALLFIACAFGIGLYLVYLIPTNIGKFPTSVFSKSFDSQKISVNSTKKAAGFLEFQKDNDTLKELITRSCKDTFLVPPLVHYVWLSKETMLFHEYVAILSASKFLKPCYILIHGDTIPSGEWWDMLLAQVKNIIHVRRQPPGRLAGKRIWYIEHKADIIRLEVLLKYGGIYADTDVYFLRSFDTLRNRTFTLSQESHSTVANGLIITSKDSVMLKVWYLTYYRFNSRSWADNSVFMAYKLCNTFPDMVHMEPDLIMLGRSWSSVFSENLLWEKNRYSVHLYARIFPKLDFTLDSIKKLNTTFGSLSRFVLFGKTDIS